MPKPEHSHSQRSLQSMWVVGRYLSWYPVAGVAFWGSWHLQTVHTSDHCDLWRCTAKHSALSGHSCSMHRRSYVLPGTQSCAYSATQSPLCLCPLSQGCPWCGTVDHSVTKQHEGTLPGDATARHRLVAGAPHRCSAPRECRWHQACTNRNDSRPC